MGQEEERVKSLDAEISKISKSTRTSLPAILPLHDILRQKSKWYYRWHLNPWAKTLHYGILGLWCLVAGAFVFLNYYQIPVSQPVKAAVEKTWDNGGGDFAWETATNWNDNTVPQSGDNVTIGDDTSMNYINVTTSTPIDLGTGSLTLGGLNSESYISLTLGGTFQFGNFAFASNSTFNTFNANGHNVTIRGNLDVGEYSNNFIGGGGTNTVTLSGVSKTISGSGTNSFNNLAITGTISTSIDLSVNNNLTIDEGATLTLSANITLQADAGSDGSGAFIMNTGSSIAGATYNLTIRTSGASALRSISNVVYFLLDASVVGSTPTYTAYNNISASTLEITNSTLTLSGADLAVLSDLSVYGSDTDGTLNVGTNTVTTQNLSILDSDPINGTTISVANGGTINVSGDFYNTSAFLAGVTSTVNLNGAGNQTVSGDYTTFGILTIGNTGTGTVSITSASTITTLNVNAGAYNVSIGTSVVSIVTGAVTFNNTGTLTLTSGAGGRFLFSNGITATIPSGINLAGTLSTSNDAISLDNVILTANSTIRSGTAATNITSVTDGASSYTLSLQNDTAIATGTVTFSGNVTINTLTTFAQAYAIAFNGTSSTIDTNTTFLNTGALTLGNENADSITFTDGVTATAPSSKSIAGTILASGTGVINLSTTAVSVTANATVGGTSTGLITLGNATLANGVTLTLGAGAATPISAGSISGTADSIASNLAINTTGTVTMGGNIGTDIGLTITSGTLAMSSYSLTVTTLSNLGTITVSTGNMSGIPNGSVGNFTFTGINTIPARTYATLEFNGGGITFTAGGAITATNITITSGTFDVNNNDITLSGNWTNSGTFTPGTGTVSFTKSSPGTQTLNSGGVGAGKAFNNLTHSGTGILQLLTSALNIDGNFFNSAGTFDANDLDINVADDFLISGGLFSADVAPGATTQTVIFDSANASTITGGTTFNNLTMDAGVAKTINFPTDIANKTTINGTWNINNSAAGEGARLTLGSSTPGVAWEFVILTDMNPSGNYITVSDSQNSTNAFRITPGANVTDSGNNLGWNFTPYAPTAASAVNVLENGATSFNTTWTDNSYNETGFKVYISTSVANNSCTDIGTVYPGSPYITTGPGVEAQIVAGQEINTQYCAKVVATNVAGDSSPAYSAVPLYTYADTPLAPGVTVQSWNPDPAIGNALTATIELGTNPDYTEYAIACNATPNSWLQGAGTCGVEKVWKTEANWETGTVNYLLNLPADTDYTLRTKARNGDSVETADSTTNGPNKSAPAQPTGLAHTANTITTITWNLNDNPVAPDGYNLLNNVGDQTLETSATSDFVQDQSDAGGTPLTANTSYTVRTRAYRGAVNGQPTTADTTSAYTSIETPTGITATADSTSQISLQVSNSLSNLIAGSSGIQFGETSGHTGGGGQACFTDWTQTNDCDDTGLSTNVQYTYEVTARNGDGEPTSTFSSQSKYTKAADPTVSAVTAQSWDAINGNAMQVTVGANGNPDVGDAQNPAGTSYYTQYKEVDAAGDCNVGGGYAVAQDWTAHSNADNISHTNRTDDKYICYQIQARNGDSATTSFSSQSNVQAAPAQVTGLAHSANTTSSVSWNWNANTVSPDGYKVYEYTGGACSATEKASVAAPAVTVEEGALSANTQYARCNRAYRGSATGQSSTNFSAYTSANVPGAPTVNATSQTSLTVIIDINANPAATEFAISNETLAKYVQADGSSGDSAVWQNYATWGGAAGIANTGLTASTTYSYKVKARNGDSEETDLSGATSQTTLSSGGSGTPTPTPTPTLSPTVSPFGEVTATPEVGESPTTTESPVTTVDTQAPSVPSNLRATKLGAIILTLAWDASTDNTGIKGYQIYNSETKILVGTTTDTFFSFSGLTPNTTYKFYVRAFDGLPNYSTGSEILSITTLESSTPEEQAIEEQGGVAAFLVITNAPSTASSGKPFDRNIKVTVADVGGNIVKGYSKPIFFNSTDTLAKFTYNESHPYTYTLEDGGIHEFSGNDFVLNTAGAQKIIVSDNSTESTIEVKVSSVASGIIQKSATYVEGFFNNPKSMSNANIIIAALIAGVFVLPVIVNGLVSLNNLLPQLVYGFLSLGQILGWRRRRKTWGVVFNSQTGQPVPFAFVKLMDKRNHLVETSVSDSQGKYGFVAKHGTYRLTTLRADFIYPSKETESSFYERVYTGSEIKITDFGQSVSFNIPLDPHAKSTFGLSFWIWLIRLNHQLQRFRLPLLALGVVFAIIMLVQSFHVIYAIFLAFCVLAGVFDLIRFRRARAFGAVSDVYSKPIIGAVVRIYHKEDNRLIDTDVTGRNGRFQFYVGQGIYYLVATKPQHIDFKSHLIYLQKEKNSEIISSINIKLKKEEK